MNIKMEHTFAWPKDEIVSILEEGDDPVPMDKLDNVKTYKVCEFRKSGDGFFKKIEWSVEGKIPVIARKAITPDMLTFVEETEWDSSTATFRTKVIPHFFQKKISCTVNVVWDDHGDSHSRRTVDINLKVKIPIIGKALEGMIAEVLKQNNEWYAGLLQTSFEERLGEPTLTLGS